MDNSTNIPIKTNVVNYSLSILIATMCILLSFALICNKLLISYLNSRENLSLIDQTIRIQAKYSRFIALLITILMGIKLSMKNIPMWYCRFSSMVFAIPFMFAFFLGNTVSNIDVLNKFFHEKIKDWPSTRIFGVASVSSFTTLSPALIRILTPEGQPSYKYCNKFTAKIDTRTADQVVSIVPLIPMIYQLIINITFIIRKENKVTPVNIPCESINNQQPSHPDMHLCSQCFTNRTLSIKTTKAQASFPVLIVILTLLFFNIPLELIKFYNFPVHILVVNITSFFTQMYLLLMPSMLYIIFDKKIKSYSKNLVSRFIQRFYSLFVRQEH